MAVVHDVFAIDLRIVQLAVGSSDVERAHVATSHRRSDSYVLSPVASQTRGRILRNAMQSMSRGVAHAECGPMDDMLGSSFLSCWDCSYRALK
jgi:hypothetical protein